MNTTHARRPRTTAGSVVTTALATVWALIVLLPIYFLLLGSFRSQADYLTSDPWLPSGDLTFSAYAAAVQGVGGAVINSVIVTIAVVLIVIIFGVPAAFALVRYRSRLTKTMYVLFLAGLAVPLEGTIVSVFILVVKLGMYDQLLGIILPLAAFNTSLAVIILVAFLRDIPDSLFEAMALDGAGRFATLISLVFPLVRPPLLGLGIFVTLQSWNSLLLPLVTTTSAGKAVLPVALLRLQGSDSANYPAILASVVLSAVPIVVLYLVGRKQLIEGMVITTGATSK
jgi:raffinose/stachyose/melibiose transport system permease protein